jgi:N-acetylmuramate 1-kinase
LTGESAITSAQTAFIRGHVSGFQRKKWEISPAGQAGSQRVFVRIHEKTGRKRSFVLVVWDSNDEDWPRFLSIPQEVSPHVSFLPEIFASDSRHGLILEEDLGDCTLNSAVKGAKKGETAIIDAYCRVLYALCAWQSLDKKASPTISSRSMDTDTFLWETEYFARRCVVDFCGCERALDRAWESERHVLAAAAASLPKTFIHRDFQSENILVNGSVVKFVDFQGARLGPPAYDVASLLYDPYVDFLGPRRTARLFEYYRSCAPRVSVSRHDFDLCAAQRLMQACGAYGNLSLHKGKVRYRRFMPIALDRLKTVMERLPEYPAIKKVVECCREAAGKKGKRLPI